MILLMVGCSGGLFTVGPAEVEADKEGVLTLLVDGEPTFQLSGLARLQVTEEVEASLGMWQFDRVEETVSWFSDFRRSSSDEGGATFFYRDAEGNEATVTAQPESEGITRFDLSVEGDHQGLRIQVPCTDDSSFLGFGEQYDAVEHSGEAFTLFVSEQGIGRDGSAWQFTGDEHTTYFPMPYYLDARGFGVLIDTDARVEASVCEGDTATFDVMGDASIQVFHGPTPKDVIEQLGQVVGRPAPPPDWAYGTWMCMQGGEQRVSEQVDLLETAGIPATVLWVQDWTGRRQNPGGGYGVQYRWEPDTDELYPNIAAFFAGLNADGYHIVGYVNPFVDPALQHWDDLEEGGMLPLHPQTGEVYTFFGPRGDMTTADLTNPATQAYIVERLEAAVDLGLEGWMADFAEWLPVDALLYEGDPAEVHNTYPELWQSLSREVLGTDGLYFARSGWTGTQGVAQVHWVGDQEADFSETDGLPTVVPAMLSLGLSGQPFVSHDIAGFSGGPSSKELYLRWTELGAFTPFMRTHDGNERDENHRWDTDAETTLHFARMARVHEALGPELQVLAAEAAQTSVPIVRHLLLEYPEDPEVILLSDQYLLGPDLLVAPVLHQGMTSREVYFPDDTWFNVWTGESFEGGWHTVDAPLGSPPVFSRGHDRTDLRAL